MRRLKAGWVTLRSSADREKFPVFARLTKSSSHFSSMLDILAVLNGFGQSARQTGLRQTASDAGLGQRFRGIDQHNLLAPVQFAQAEGDFSTAKDDGSDRKSTRLNSSH